jgi:hypothetical protein
VGLWQEVNHLLGFQPYKKWHKDKDNIHHHSIYVSQTEMQLGASDVQKEQTKEDLIVKAILFSVGTRN